jgi:hypothetical protein
MHPHKECVYPVLWRKRHLKKGELAKHEQSNPESVQQ